MSNHKSSSIAVLSAALFLFCTTCALHAAQYSSDKITAINFEGLKNVKEKAVKNKIKSKVGKYYFEDTVKSDIKSILSMDSFESVEVAVDTATWRLTFQLKEKPYIKKVVFKGNKKVSSGRLKEEMLFKEKEFFDTARFEESKAKMQSLYADKGYSDCKIEAYPTTDETTNQMTITFLITEGNRITIGDIRIEGVKSYKPKKIRKLMKTKPKKVFKEETLRTDIEEIEKFYKNNGYMQVKVSEPRISYNEERTRMTIEIAIEEGPKYKIGSISFSGNSIYTEPELRKAMTIKSGQLYREEDFQDTRSSLGELYSEKGYLHAQIEPEFTPEPEKGIMNIAFSITENSVVYLGKVYIDGLANTKEYVIRREVTLKEGDVFAAPRVRRSMEKIYNLGFIDAVEPEIQPTSQLDVMDLVLNITEGKPGILSAGAGYSSVDQLVGTLQVQHINLLGRAQRLNLLWEFGARKQNYEITWTEPWLLNKPMSLGVGVFNTERLRDYGSIIGAYREGRKGGSVSIGPRIGEYLSLSFGYTYEEVRVFDIDTSISSTTLTEAGLAETHDITSSLISSVVWDTRDNIFDASRGNRQALSVQFAGGPLGGNINFIKPSVKSSWYFPTFWKFVFSVNGSFGLVENFGDSTDVPIYERYYVGGAETVRGYEYRQVGPANGGKIMSVFNAEYKFPIVQEKKRTILQGAFFYDIGGSWLSPNDINFTIGENENEMKSGVGFGIRFTTPVFPLRLDWGYGLNHKPGEELSQFYFTIGNIF